MEKKMQLSEPVLAETKKLLEFILRTNHIKDLDLPPRETTVIKMKWTYGLTDEQAAEKLGIKKASLKAAYDMALLRVLHDLFSCYKKASEAEALKKEMERLKKENNNYRKKFDALSIGDKEKFNSLDIVVKNVQDVGFSKKTFQALDWSKINTVSDLLQYRLSSLLLMKEFNLPIVEEIEQFADKHRLKMKK